MVVEGGGGGGGVVYLTIGARAAETLMGGTAGVVLGVEGGEVLITVESGGVRYR